ncbi:MAG: sodium-translocating pyrophosphatase [Candidatus Hodarchaeota archaeon]
MINSVEKIWSALNDGEYRLIFQISFYLIIPIGLASAVVAILLIFKNLKQHEAEFKKMRQVHKIIQNGAKTYLKRQAKTLIVIVIILFIPVGLTGAEFLPNSTLATIITGSVFCLGALSSLFAGYVSMDAATSANIIVVEAAARNPLLGFKKGYYTGMISGILNISVFVLGIWLLFLLTRGNINLLVGYSFGASVSSLLSQVGGGIFTKSADMGADLVGKFEIGIDEDDPRNPAIIADAVGDNVGDCAGRGADLFESASSDAVGGMILGFTIFLISGNPIFIISDLTLLSTGIFASYLSSRFLKSDIEKNPTKVVWVVFVVATGFNFILLFIINLFLHGPIGYLLFICSLSGLVASLLSIIITLYYTDVKYKPTMNIAEASQQGPAINAVTGLSAGFESTFFPLLIFGGAVVFSYIVGYQYGTQYIVSLGIPFISPITGEAVSVPMFSFIFAIWGVNMASVSSDMLISTILSFDTFGPIMDNAAGITEMAQGEGPSNLRTILDKLDATGNTTKAIAKGFALVCGGFSSIVLFQTFILNAGTLANDPNFPSAFSGFDPIEMIMMIDVTHPIIILGLMLGVVLPFLFSSKVIKAVGRGASEMVTEVRRQFYTIEGLRDGNADPDYDRCIDISAKNALRSMVFPVVLIIAIPIGFGILFGPFAMGALLVGNLIGCLIVGLFMSMSGGAFDNAKKAIEAGLFGGKGTAAHKASIIGDTIGDPLKDSAGPSMNIEITTVNTLALTFLPVIMMAGWFWGIFPFF